MKRFYLLVLFLAGLGSLNAQQIPIDNQYMLNKFSMSPAYAGYTGNYETFISYRKNWVSIPGAPVNKMINFNGPAFRNMGVGGSVSMQTAGIFNSVSATASYSYRLNISEKHAITFAAYAGLFENHLEINGINSQNELDPVVADNQMIKGSMFDAGIGILYRFKHLNVGIVIPRLLESDIESNNADEDVLYTLKRHYKFHASYNINLPAGFQVEPIAVVGKTQASPFFYEITALVKYRQQVWLGLTYRKLNCIGVTLGATYSRFVLNYTYEFSGSGILGQSSGTHEVAIGLLIGKNKETKYQPSVFKSKANQPYHKYSKDQ